MAEYYKEQPLRDQKVKDMSCYKNVENGYIYLNMNMQQIKSALTLEG